MKALRTRYELKVSGELNFDTEGAQETVFLNRILRIAGHPRYGDQSFEIEGDPRHAEIIVQELGRGDVKSNVVDTPGVKPTSGYVQERLKSDKLVGSEIKQYRSLVMRSAYLAADRADLGNAVKNLAKRMQEPRQLDMTALKRVGRYLKGRPRVVQCFRKRAVGDDSVAGLSVTAVVSKPLGGGQRRAQGSKQPRDQHNYRESG